MQPRRVVVRVKLVRVGNSQGVRLSKALLAKAGIADEVEIEVERGRIVLTRPGWRPRAGWAESVAATGPDKEDRSDWQNMRDECDETEWTWPDDFKWPEEQVVFTLVPALDEALPTSSDKSGSPRRSKRRLSG
jgi:antitoxin MazE